MQQSELRAALLHKFPVALEEAGTGAVVIPKDALLKVAAYLKDAPLAFDDLHCVTAVDRPERIEVVYILYSIREHHTVTLKVYLPREAPNVPSLTPLWRSADWLERETYDLLGVHFSGHPDLRRILNPYDWKGYPLCKDYAHPDLKVKPRL